MKALEDKLEAVVMGIKPILDFISFKPPEGMVLLPSHRPPWPILNRCQEAWKDFKAFSHSATHSIVVHALAVLRSHYPSVKPEMIMTGYA